MADNVEADAGSGGAIFAAASLSISGDTAVVPMNALGILSGSEGSWSYTLYVGGAGAVSAGVQRVTLASDDPAVVDLAAIEVLLTTIDADTGNIVTAVQLLDDAIYTDGTGTPSKGIAVMGTDGTNPQLVSVNSSGHVNIADGGNIITVDGTVAATQSGTWNITNISGTVSLPTGAATAANQSTGNTALSSIQTAAELIDDAVYVDDADWADGTSKHILVGGLYQSSQQAITDGDVGPLQVDENGNLKVAIISGAGSGGTASDDDADFTAGTTAGTPAMGVYESSPSSVTDGDLGLVGITQTRALRVSVDNTVTVASHAVTNAGAFAVQADQSGTWNITNVSGTISLPTGAATAAKQPALGTAGSASADVITVQGIASMTPLLVTAQASTNTQEVVGDAAHGVAVAGNPVLVGLEGRSTDGTAIDSGDVVRALASLLGKQVILPYALPGATWQYAAVSGGVTDTADDAARAAQGAGTRNYVTHCSVVNGHATVSTEVVIKSGSTVIWRGWAQAAGGGVAERFDPPLRGGDNEAINVTNITTGSATYFNLQGYSATE